MKSLLRGMTWRDWLSFAMTAFIGLGFAYAFLPGPPTLIIFAVVVVVFAGAYIVYRVANQEGAQVAATVHTARAAISRGDLARAESPLVAALAYYRRTKQPTQVAHVLNNLGSIAMRRGEYVQGIELFEESLTLTADNWQGPHYLEANLNVGVALLDANKLDAANQRLTQTLALATQAPNQGVQAQALTALGRLAGQQGDFAAAVEYFERALETQLVIGEPAEVATALEHLGYALLAHGDIDRAESTLTQAVDRYRTTPDRLGLATALGALGLAQLRQQRSHRAHTTWRDSLSTLTTPNPLMFTPTLDGLAAMLAHQEPARAARLIAAATGAFGRRALPPDAFISQLSGQTIAQIRQQLEPAAFDQAWADGLALDPAAVVAEALAAPTATPKSSPKGPATP